MASGPSHIFKSHSCPSVFKYLEELDFDEKFELSLFKTQSESALDSLFPNPDFVAALEIERTNKEVENFILQHLQSDIHATNLVDFLEAVFDYIGSTITAIASHEQTALPFISISPITTDPETTIRSSPSSHITSPPHTPPHTPHTTATTTAPTTPRPNLPREMAARFAPLALPQNMHDIPADYQSKIPMFDGTPQSIFAQ